VLAAGAHPFSTLSKVVGFKGASQKLQVRPSARLLALLFPSRTDQPLCRSLNQFADECIPSEEAVADDFVERFF
jgi:hypothetical protein